jgi:hypothetical protein
MYLTRGTYNTRIGKWDDSFIEKAYQLCILGATLKVLSVAFDVEITTIEKWKETKPAFRRAVEKGLLEINERVAFSFVKAACGYEYEEEEIHSVDKQLITVKVKRYAKPDTWAARIWLMVHMPETWGNPDKIKEGNTIININKIDMNILSTDELKLMESIAQKNNMLSDDIAKGE